VGSKAKNIANILEIIKILLLQEMGYSILVPKFLSTASRYFADESECTG
jgi:hypothetical protein